MVKQYEKKTESILEGRASSLYNIQYTFTHFQMIRLQAALRCHFTVGSDSPEDNSSGKLASA